MSAAVVSRSGRSYPATIRFLVSRLSLMTIILLTGACASPWNPLTVTENDSPKQIQKSPGDDRDYQAFTLENGLGVLVVSDPSADKAAAALDVNVGSGSDPRDREGLAHFLEHMLFLGTEKYPDPGEYQAFINRNGGSHNAFTAFEHTNYFFDVDADYLEPALDRFSQQFVAPLFTAELVERERNAVHSEYTSKLQDDGRRFFAVVKQAINPEHPMSKFAVGNLDTLSDTRERSVRADLLDFYESNYSADRMKLVVYGRESTVALEAMVRQKFSAVKRRDLEEEPTRPHLLTDKQAPALVQLKPVKEKRSLSLLFSMPPTEPYYHSKPAYYLTNLIGHEGEGSLLSWLRDQQLAEGLSAGLFTSEDDSSVLSISVMLTEKGRKQYETVIRDTLTYIDRMKNEGIEKWRFEEQARMLDISFRFQDKAPPIHYVSSLATRLQDFAPEEVLAAPYAMDDFDGDILREFAGHLRADNMLAILVAPDVETDQIETWYQVPYSVKPLSDEQIASISKLNPDAEMHMPQANDFIPEELEIVAGESMPHPERLLSVEGYEAWYARDTSFGSPKSSFYLSVRSPLANQSAKDQVLTELYISLAKDALSEYTYPAYLAGLDFRLYKHLRGITLRIDGFSDRQPVLIQRILATLKAPQFRTERFNQVKKDLQRELRNTAKDKPFERLAAEARSLLLEPYWTEEQQLDALQNLELVDLQAFVDRFWTACNLVTLSHGNVSHDQALEATKVIRGNLLQGMTPLEVEKSRVVDVHRSDWFREIATSHQDTAYLYYVQGPSKSFADRAAFGLLSQIIGPDYYSTIRTQAQMGYVVFATPYTLLDVPALAFIVQSPSHTAEQIHAATSAFISDYVKRLESLPADEFAKHKEALITRLTETDKTLEQRSDRYWTEIDAENEQFDSMEQIASEVAAMKQEDLTAYFRTHFIGQPQALLLTTVQENGQNDPTSALPEKLGLEVIAGRDQWLEQNTLFPAGR